jgi:hypothetical protein
MKVRTSIRVARREILGALVAAAALGGACKRPVAPADAGHASPAAAHRPEIGASRFLSVAEMRRHPVFAAFASFVETDDDLEESASAAAAMGEEELDDLSPDRPPSDIHLARLALPGEVYALSYEENCGEGLEDRRNLHHVVLERRGSALQEVLREPLCGEAERGFAIDLVDLSGRRRPDLVARTWVVDPEGASEHALRVYRPGPGGLVLVGSARDEVDGGERFEAHYPRSRGGALVEVRFRVRGSGDGIGTLQVRRYRLDRSGLVPAAGR